MKFFVFFLMLGAWIVADAARPSQEAFCIFGWIAYAKRLFILGLVLSGLVLYYIPESRFYARKACRRSIDLAAEALKSIITDDLDRIRYKINDKPLTQLSKRVADADDVVYESRRRRKASKLSEEKLLRREERKKQRPRASKHENYHNARPPVNARNEPAVLSESTVEIAPSNPLRAERPDDYRKLVKSKFYCAKKPARGSYENYATFLISGSPREMAMIEGKYEKDDIVILEEPQENLSEDKSDRLRSADYQTEGPTRDPDSYALRDPKNSEKVRNEIDIKATPAVSESFGDQEDFDHSRKNNENQRVFFGGEKEEMDDSPTSGLRAGADLQLDEKPERESHFLRDKAEIREAYGSLIDDLWGQKYPQPALMRVIQWLFGSCPSEHVEKVATVGNEEIEEIANQWYL